MELLFIAQCFKIPIAEVAVNWTEIEGKFSINLTNIPYVVVLVIYCTENTKFIYIVSIVLVIECCWFFFFRIQAGPILELATNGRRPCFHSAALHNWCMEAAAST